MQAVRRTSGSAITIHPQVRLHGRPWSIEFSSAGGGFEPPAAKEWSPARLSVRLPGLDSSNTWRIAFKSSVAEMMGKSRNSNQESATAAWSDLKRSCRSQEQNASGTSSSQQRLSSSSNIYSRARKRLSRLTLTCGHTFSIVVGDGGAPGLALFETWDSTNASRRVGQFNEGI